MFGNVIHRLVGLAIQTFERVGLALLHFLLPILAMNLPYQPAGG
jgi:hypothetical protein